MSSTTRAYVKGDDPMYRSVTPYEYTPRRYNYGTRKYEPSGPTEHRTAYAGPYATVGAAKRSRGTGGWVEVCHPVWERLEE